MSLIAFYQFEDDATDDSGNGYDGSESGTPTYEAGVDSAKKAIRFDGTTSERVEVAHNAGLNLSSACTLMAWIKPDALQTQFIMVKAILNQSDGYGLYCSSGGVVYVRFNQDTSGDTYRCNSSSSYPTNGTTWMHVAGTFDGTNIRIYINGSLENTVGASSLTIGSNTDNLGIGDEAGGRSPFDGAIDQVRIYDTALSSTEINTIISADQGGGGGGGTILPVMLQQN